MTFISVKKQTRLSILTSFHGTLCASLFSRFTSLSLSLSLSSNSSSFILIRFIHWKKSFCYSSRFAWLIYFHLTSTVINTLSSSERNRNKTSSFFRSFTQIPTYLFEERSSFRMKWKDMCSMQMITFVLTWKSLSFFLSFPSSSFLTSGTHSWISSPSLSFSFFLSSFSFFLFSFSFFSFSFFLFFFLSSLNHSLSHILSSVIIDWEWWMEREKEEEESSASYSSSLILISSCPPPIIRSFIPSCLFPWQIMSCECCFISRSWIVRCSALSPERNLPCHKIIEYVSVWV